MEEEYPQVDLSYQQDLEIDQHNLELEWVRQAKLMDRYSIVHAQAIFNRNRADDLVKSMEANLKKVFAELDGEARGPVLPEGLAKQTDEAVKQWVIRQDHYQEAQANLDGARKQWSEAQYVVDVMFGAVMAFQGKKTGLEELVLLFKMKYYAEPYEQGGTDMKPRAMEQGRMAATEAMKKLPVDGNTPKVSVTLGPVPSPALALDRDKDGYRYAVGPIVAELSAFAAGPFSQLQQALKCIGEIGMGIYRLTKHQPDELIYIWNNDDWEPAEAMPRVATPKPTSLPPRPPQRPPLLKR